MTNLIDKVRVPRFGLLALAFGLMILALFLTSRVNYLLFHTLVELLSIAISWGMFILVWNARRWMDNAYLFGLGVALAAAGGLDLIHTLSYKGMNLFPGFDTNLPTQLWIAARYLQSLSMLFAAMYLPFSIPLPSNINGRGKARTGNAFEFGLVAFYSVVTVLVLALIFGRWFPVCYIEGQGLTSFKIISEYVIGLILLISLAILWKKRVQFDRFLLQVIIAATIITILSELAFTFYVGVYDFSNLVGHFCKLAAFFLFYLAVIRAGLQRPYGLLFRNLSEQANALKKSEERLESAFGYAPIGMAWVSPDGRFLKVNPAVCRLLGYSEEELLKMTFKQITHPDDLVSDLGYVQQLLVGEILSYQMEKRYYDKNNTVVWVQLSVSLIRDDRGQPIHFISQIQDITERKRSEEAIRLQVAALNSTVNAMVITDRDGAIQWINPAFTKLTGYTQEDVLGKNTRVLKSGVQSPQLYQQMWDTIRVGNTWIGELVNRRKDGSLYHEEMTITPITDASGRIDHYIGVKLDISERKQLQAILEQERAVLEDRVAARTSELSQANASLLQAVRVKDEFLASMSHELRTPLTGILGYAEVLRTGVYGELNEKTSNALHKIEESGQHLLSLINDILDLSKIEAGKIDLDLKPATITSVVQGSLHMVRQNAQKKRINLSVDLDPAVENIIADERRLKQILVNLLSNAVKFTGEGGSVGIEVQGSLEARRVDFIVWDTGIGIRPEDMDRLFKPFVQLDAGLDRQYGGTGLGLSLVYKLVELHGGGIQIESQPGEGSRFIVSLPWRRMDDLSWRDRIPKITPASTLLPRSAGLENAVSAGGVLQPRCLIVEDNEITLGVVRDYLNGRGYSVIEARNGVEAIQRAHELRPDAIIMDIQMPVMDGLKAIQILRQDPQFVDTPIIALSALAMKGDQERILGSGADDYLSKPVNLAALEQTLARLLG